jgi:hypothetical protein
MIFKCHGTLKSKEEYINQDRGGSVQHTLGLFEKNIRHMSINVWKGKRKSQGIEWCPVQKTVVLHCHPPLKNKVREQLPEFHLSY